MGGANYQLIIGDKNYSSWSLRPWLLMRVMGIPFSETKVLLKVPERHANILKHSPSGKVPALKVDGQTIWDTLAIIEFMAERHPDKPVWPRDAMVRALARSASAEMHSGFADLRNEMPMDILRHLPKPPSEAVQKDVRRIVEIWRLCRRANGKGGPFLFGAFSAADAMYAPVATRFRTYGVDLAALGDDGTAAAYGEAILAMPEMAEWSKDARAELKERGETL
ncbi:MAG: glutathione S-transferase family protein [Pseudomonadota bacterium]|nr:glutathione S-transferase family protein [Pseudomonadota bacterium]